LESPLYVALSEWLPPLNADVVYVATPLPFNGSVPSGATPSANVTVPVGTAPELVRVIVKVTELPKVAGLLFEVIDTVTGAVLTVWVNTEDVLPLKLELPP